MKQDDLNTFQSVNDMADTLPYGRERTALREKAINLADLSGDERQQFEARKEFVNDVSNEGGFSEKYFTVFPWLLNYAHQKGTDDDKMIVLWYYKWIVSEMPEFPAVTKTQITNALEDLRKRYIEYGSNEKVFHQYAADAYMLIGENEKSKYHYDRWKRFKNRDYLDDCPACVVNRAVHWEASLGTVEDALKVAQPVLKGRLVCTHVPKGTYSYLLLPLVRNDKPQLADMYAEKLYKLLLSSKYGGDNFHAHTVMIYYAKQEDFTRSVKLFEKYMKIGEGQKNLYSRFYFYLGALYLFSRIKKDTIKLKLPPKNPLFSADNTYETAALREWFDHETDAIAALFDKRNENIMVSMQKKELLAL